MELEPPQLVFETIEPLRLVVCCQTKLPPHDKEWKAWLAATDALRDAHGNFRLLVYTDGGHPTASQKDTLRIRPPIAPLTAVVSSQAAVRFAMSVFSFINRNIRCFSPTQRQAAYAHLKLELRHHKTVDQVLNRLLRQIGSPTQLAS